MLAWFNGYSYGAIYAEQEGISGWGRIVTAPTLPPYRKKRPVKAPLPPESMDGDPDYVPNGQPGIAPYAVPESPNDPSDAPNASAAVIELEEPVDESGNPANAAVVRWTDAAEGY
jgi:hypothetical protein